MHNYSSATITEIYFTGVGNPDWGPDRLGQGTIPPGYYNTIDPGYQNGYCMLDIEIIFDDGSKIDDRFDACTVEDYNARD